jgi:predicted ATP-dependent endonuclease of OLD family
LKHILINTILSEECEKADAILKAKESLIQAKRELETQRKNQEEQKEAYEITLTQLQGVTVLDIDRKIHALSIFGDELRNIKATLMEAVNKIRTDHLLNLRTSFKETFKRIYPYPRLTNVDFETVNIRGREILQVKAKTDGGWVYSHQMSTGENVALSFALLYAINHLEKSPILLLDEPEEGLDEKGEEGLADMLNSLKAYTQIAVATRSPHLTQILHAKSEITS